MMIIDRENLITTHLGEPMKLPLILSLFLTLTSLTMPASGQISKYASPAVAQAARSVVSVHASGYLGSGTYLGDGLFITCHHVVEGRIDKRIQLHCPTKDETWVGRVIHINPKNDLAIIRVKGEVNLKPIRIAQEEPTYGIRYFGVGFGASYKTTEIDRRIWAGRCVDKGSINASLRLNDFTFYNTAIKGDSGGAAFNRKGELIGVVWGASTGRTHCIATWAIRKALEACN